MLWILLTALVCLAVVIGLLVLVIFWYFARHRKYWPEKGVLHAGGMKVVGNPIKNIISPMTVIELDSKFYNFCKKENVNYVGSHEFSIPFLFCRDIQLIKKVFVKDFDHFTNRREFSFASEDPHLSKMLFTMEGDDWKELRVKMSPTFTTGKIRKMFQIFEDCSGKLVKYLSDEMSRSETGTLDLSDGFGRYTMDVIATAAFGVDSRTFEEKNSKFYEMGNRMRFRVSVAIIFKMFSILLFPKLSKFFGIRFGEKEPDEFFTRIIKSVLRQRESMEQKRNDFIQLMIEARDGKLGKVEDNELDTFEKDAQLGQSSGKDKIIFDDDCIIAQSILFILGGFDTTMSLLIFAAYELALSPDIQEKLADEVISVWEEGNHGFTYESVNNMEYLDKVINETLRMYPPAARLERRCSQRYQIPDTDIILEKDTLFFIPVYGIHHDEEHYPEPEKFDPERFSIENKGKRNPDSFMPFGHGPRNCIGRRFALMEVKVALAHFVRNFVVEPCEKTLIPMKFSKDASTKPEGGMWLKLTTRK